MEINRDEIRQLIDSLQEIQKALKDATPRTNTSQANFTISAGGAGVWIATTCCMIMIGMMLVGTVWLSREMSRLDSDNKAQDSQISDTKDYLQAIYSMAPQLKPAENKEDKEEAKP